MTRIKYHPILFGTEMVQAILQDRKTQTRRILKPQPKEGYLPKIKKDHFGKLYLESRKSAVELELKQWKPYQVGDILWVRETFYKPIHEELRDRFFYKADLQPQGWSFKWKPSIHMPKAAARIFLKVLNVRVERLQDISEEDAIAEGIIHNPFFGYECSECDKKGHGASIICEDGFFKTAKEAFRSLWISIYGVENWEQNPYVFVYEYERIEKPKNF